MLSKLMHFIYRYLGLIFTLIVTLCVGCYLYFIPIVKNDVFTVNINEPISHQYHDYFYDYYGYSVDLSKQLPTSFDTLGNIKLPVKVGPYTFDLTFDVVDNTLPQVTVVKQVVDSPLDFMKCIDITSNSDVKVIKSAYAKYPQWMSNGMQLYTVTYTVNNIAGTTTSQVDILVTNGQKITSDLGYDYSLDLDQLIQQYCDNQGIDYSNIAFGYHNYLTNEAVSHLSNQSKFAASTYKLPLNMLIMNDLSKGDLTKDSQLCFKEEYYVLGGGFLEQNYSFNEWIPVLELVKESLLYSSNTASTILFNHYGSFKQFKEKAQQFSTSAYAIENDANMISVDYLMDCWDVIFNDINTYKLIVDILSQAEIGTYGRYGTKIPLAHKYGIYEQTLNDTGFVFGPIPFTYAILGTNISEVDLGNIVNIMINKTLYGIL